MLGVFYEDTKFFIGFLTHTLGGVVHFHGSIEYQLAKLFTDVGSTV